MSEQKKSKREFIVTGHVRKRVWFFVDAYSPEDAVYRVNTGEWSQCDEIEMTAFEAESAEVNK